MTTTTSADLVDTIDPRLADLVAEAVVWTDDGAARAETLVTLLGCTVDAVRWRLEPDGDAVEEQSIEQVLRAAVQHLDRMRARSRSRPDV